MRALRHEVFADAMDLILAHEQLMDNILASSMSGMLTSMICDRIARSIRGRVMSALDEDALAPYRSRQRLSLSPAALFGFLPCGGNRATY